MLNLKSNLITGSIAFFFGLICAWWLTADYKEAKYQQIISEMKLEASEALTQVLQKHIETEQVNAFLTQNLEVTHDQLQNSLLKQADLNRRLTTELGGLYDSKATCGSHTSEPNTQTPFKPSQSTTGARLSKEATEFLLNESRRADEAAAYAQSCYAWIEQLIRR